MSQQPIEARCDHCAQTRPLFLYEADHDFHLTGITCEWCARDKQPLLCARCWSTEKQREEAAPGDPQDNAMAAFLVRACENNARILAREEADKATCEGIATATERTEKNA
ncbi:MULTISPECIES: hypothetical protein [Streptomyces]|uniref:hypothetical protein n=1 Tax=Streptomyces TaxID=1883 RepID=UPI00081B18B0|nr:hypothetical protein [Streptomyces sp. BvitLS-983]MYX88412.1 hypothetical protein [Streptomyces sp. SID4915]SCE16509.1 hypothetical protein GA0115250_144740 [Streptomyces sp. BvitLS-983]